MITKIKISGYRIHRSLTLFPNRNYNLIVGANESGKSTLLEAITLALTGRINGRSASEELNPYWFNNEAVNDFCTEIKSGKRSKFPEIRIELFFEDVAVLQNLCGACNSDVPTNACPGLVFKVIPNTDYADELTAWMKDPSPLLPVEYYIIDWRSFADEKITTRPKQLATAVIDSRTVRNTSTIDYHLRQILGEHLDSSERAAISLDYRKMKSAMTDTTLGTVNSRMSTTPATIHSRPIALAMDQSARTSWESAVTPHVDKIPFSMVGQGQQAAIKISLAMTRHASRAAFVTIEEPENHLTHTSLAKLLSRIESLAGSDQQLFVTTHSSFVLNRLGLDKLLLLGNLCTSKVSDLKEDTVNYFQKLPGYDTLRIVLAEKIALVEGPSDEIIFERIFKDIYGKRPIELGIDVISMHGLSLARGLELCSVLNKQVAALRDNDGKQPADLRAPLAHWLEPGKRQVFIGEVNDGVTLEPQIISHNGEEKMRKILGITESADLSTWTSREKTETALRIATSADSITPPEYMRAAAEFLHG